MKFGMMNSPWRDIEDEFKLANKLGLSFIDLTIEHPVPRREAIMPSSVKKLLRKYHLGVVGHTNWRAPIGHEIEGVRKAAAHEIIKTAELLNKIGVKKINVHCDENVKLRLGKDFILEQHIHSLKEIIKHTKKNKQILMLENSYPFETFKEIKIMLKAVPELRLHLDIGHANLAGKKEIENFIIKGRNFIEHMHIHDNFGRYDDHLFLGKGNINWQRVFGLLKKIGYNKTITLETFMVKKGKKLRLVSMKERKMYFRKQLMLLKRWGVA